jgi:sugar transferase (PEP-CTERM system associated)
MHIRLFGHHWHLPLILLWLFESGVATGAYWRVAELTHTAPTDISLGWRHALIFAVPLVVSMVALGLFTRRQRDRMTGVVVRITLSVVGATAIAELIYAIATPDLDGSLLVLSLTAMLTWALLVLVRALAVRFIDDDIFKRRVLVIGAGSNAARIEGLRRRADRRAFKVVGYVTVADEASVVPADRIVAANENLTDYVRDSDVDEIVVAMEDRRGGFPLRTLLDCRLGGVEITEAVTFLERETGKVYLEELRPSWMIFGGGFRRDVLRRYSERGFDVGASALLLMLSFPLMLLTALAIKLEDGFDAPVLYRQQRVGYQGRLFDVIKFRSMRLDAESDGPRWATLNDSRVTRVGSVIRKLRIDELPQLLTVLRGKMSFVGPRPERPEFVTRLAGSIPYYQERHAVKPGITGWAQLCYPYGASEQDALEKLQYDLFYVKNHGLLFDLLILLQTVEVILFGKGAR